MVAKLVLELGLSFRDRVYTPFVTLYACISQAVNDDGSDRRAVAEVIVQRSAAGDSACSAGTACFSRAKARLPVEFFSTIARLLFKHLSTFDTEEGAWAHGPVKVVDGTGISVADSAENLEFFSRQNSRNKKSTDRGFPLGRLLGVFSLTTGGLVDLEIENWKGKGSGELSLMHQLWRCFNSGDTVLADALFCNYFFIANAQKRGVEVVCEFPKKMIKRINKRLRDQVIVLAKPRKPEHLSQLDYDALPNEIHVRVVKLLCAPQGFRAKEKWILTTHLDSEKVSVEEICNLYKQRWQVELNYRSLKTVLGMDHIEAKSPKMVKIKIWTYMIVYNLIRIKMAESGRIAKAPVNKLSFRAAQQMFTIVRALASHTEISPSVLSNFILANQVGDRPDRYEPRAVKRRKKNYALLSETREEAKAKLHKKRKK